MAKDDKRKSAYQKAFKKFGVDARSLQWRSKKSAEVRYRAIVDNVIFDGKSVLDVGCGFGVLYESIKRKNSNFKYLGVDIVPEFVKAAQNRFHEAEFLTRDYFNNPIREKFDIVVSSGTLNANSDNPMEYRKRAIKTMLNHANEKLVFNMAGAYPQPENKNGARVWYADADEIRKYCATLGKSVEVVNNYRLMDFTIIVSV